MKTPKSSDIIGLITALGIVLALSAHGHGKRGKDDICRECKFTARAMYQSAVASARSDYYLAIARASTFSDEDKRSEGEEEAGESYQEDHLLAREQYQARLDICRILDECRYDPVIDPEDFLTPAEIAANPNPYWPMVPGTTYRYRSITEDGEEEIIEVRFTDETREILGVPCIVARDTVRLDGEIIEDTWDWYTQDREGNVWYFGEFTLEFEDGELQGLEGSFEAGVDGGKPGIIMKANPQPGDAYRQEMFLGEAEDWAQVLALGQSVSVVYGAFDDCVKTANYNPTGAEPTEPEWKYYAPGIGFVLEEKPGGETVELIAIEHD